MALRVLEECQISLPPTSPSRPALPLTIFDAFWLNWEPAEHLNFYSCSLSTAEFLESHLPNLKSSLVFTLNNFYPLAGVIRPSSDSFDSFEICYSDGDSVPLTIYEYVDADYDHISSDRRSYETLKGLAPILQKSPEAQQLLALQVTIFPNEGICLALSISHAACDGFSTIHFLKSWAAAAASRAVPPPPPLPSLDRSFISDPSSFYSKLASLDILTNQELPNQPIFQTSSFPSPPTLSIATFTITSSQIKNLKHIIQSKAIEQGNPSIRISTFVISAACAWTCLIKSKGYDLNRTVHLIIAVDWRNRMHAPFPENYFGNFLGSPLLVSTTVGKIIAEKDGFFMACELIVKAIEGIGDNMCEEINGTFQKMIEIIPQEPLSFAGYPKLHVYELDFGWGKPEKVDFTSIGKTGEISLMESREDEDGVEIGVALTEHEIDEFGKQFQKIQRGFEDINDPET